MQLRVKMAEKVQNIVFTSKQTTNKVPHNIFRGLEVATKVRLMFGRAKHNSEDSWNVFSAYKQTIRCSWSISSCNNSKSVVNGFVSG